MPCRFPAAALLIAAAALSGSLRAAPAPSPAPSASPPYLAPLSVRGNQLIAGGTAVILRGVAVGDPILARAGRPLSDYNRIATDWHANVVRISIHPSVWKHQPHGQVLETLQREIEAALGAGLYVILDWHTIGWPDGYYEAIRPAWDDDPRDLYDSSFALARDFWNNACFRFGDDPRIIFELWNEPILSKKEGNHEPRHPHWEELRPYMATLLSDIRRFSHSIVLATGDTWAYDLRGIAADPLDGPNVAYAWHIYAGTDDNSETLWARHLAGLDQVAPVIVTEWGFQEHTSEPFRGTPATFGNKFVRDFLEARHLSSTAWCWHPDWTPVMLQPDWKTPTPFGRFVLDYLHSSPSPGHIDYSPLRSAPQ